MRRRAIHLLLAAAMALGALALPGDGADAKAGPKPAKARQARPMVFVHGFFGSGAQFESQALRFTSNGYPVGHIEVHEYDTLFTTETRAEVFARLDARIDALLARTRADRIDLLGHSLGTSLMQEYLNSSAERAAKVAHYVNLDGAPATAPPGGVPTHAIWGRGNEDRKIDGATNVYFSDQTHTQVVTSEETFAELYRFFNGKAPKTVEVVPSRSGRVRVSGRAVVFPQNTGVTDATLEIYPVDAATGARLRSRPQATFALDGDGSWGPFPAKRGRHYEFAIVREGAVTHHLYVEPFVRPNAWVRLLSSTPTGGIADLVETGPSHAALVIVRYKEWWGEGPVQDGLSVDGVDLLNGAIAPLNKRALVVFAHDAGTDGISDLGAPIPAFAAIPFITGADVFVAASDPPDRAVAVVNTPRGEGGRVVTVNVPNWASSQHRISVHFNDWLPEG